MTCWSRFPTKERALLNLRPVSELCTHPSKNIQAQVNRPTVSWSQTILFESISLGEGARNLWQPSDLPAWEERLPGCSVAVHILSTDFRPWEHDKSVTNPSIYWFPSPTLVSIIKGWEERMHSKERGHLFLIASVQPKVFAFRTLGLLIYSHGSSL